MPQCHNCGHQVQGGMKFCPECGQDLTVVVPQEHRIAPEEVPTPEEASQSKAPPPPLFGGETEGAPRQEASGPLSNIPRKWLIGLIGFGGLAALLLVALLVVSLVSGPSNKTAAQSGGGQENRESERKPTSKNKSGPENFEVAVGETAELGDRTLTVAEVERPYRPQERFSKADRGKEFLRVWVTFTNTGYQPFSYNLHDFKVQDSNGVQQGPGFVSTQVPYELGSGDLAPDGTAEGNIVFEVPQGDNDLQLIYEANMFGGDTVTVRPL